MDTELKKIINQHFEDVQEVHKGIRQEHITEEYKYTFAFTDGYALAINELFNNKEISEETAAKYLKKLL
jgi:hypothetical protein